jgi:hypothetical protein
MRGCLKGALLVVAVYTIFFISNLHQTKENLHLAESDSALPRTSRLEFVSYTSSEWERLWLENVDKWIQPKDSSEGCRQLMVDQIHFVHDFLNLTCTTRFPPPYEEWCCMDDFANLIYYNTSSRNGKLELSYTPPPGLIEFLKRIPPVRAEPVIPTARDEHVVSKFVFRDTATGEELVEYIEPLVSHLRFPLYGCLAQDDAPHFIVTKIFIIPPDPNLRSSTHRRFGNARTRANNRYHDKYLFFDAGASSWSAGAGGASLEYFANMWQRHGIVFDEIYAFEATTSPEEFYRSIPTSFWSNRTTYQQGYVSSRLEDDTPSTPFIPKYIQNHATAQDYVIFKLDIDSPGVEEANIEYLVDSVANNAHLWIDELVWEHHIYENPFMRWSWFQENGPPVNGTDQSLRGSYNLFLKMRKLGIRAHSWI